MDPKIWLDAAGQMFFTLSLGFGALIAFASYLPTKNDCLRDAYTVVIINCSTSLLAGIVVFMILGHRELETGELVIKVYHIYYILLSFQIVNIVIIILLTILLYSGSLANDCIFIYTIYFDSINIIIRYLNHIKQINLNPVTKTDEIFVSYIYKKNHQPHTTVQVNFV